MEKVRLTVDELRVQSFATTGNPAAQRGTVRGHDIPTDQVECPTADVAWQTCKYTCGCGGGNTDDCTVICQSDACSEQDCTYGCPWDWSVVPSRC